MLKFKMLVILVLLLVAVTNNNNARADQILFSGNAPSTLVVPPSSQYGTLTAGFNTFAGSSMQPVTNLQGLEEADENPYAFIAPEAGILADFLAVIVMSVNLPAIGPQDAPGPLTLECMFRRANLTSGFVDTALGSQVVLPSGTYQNYRFNMTDHVDDLSLQMYDRVTLQVRVSCPADCLGPLFVSVSLTATTIFQPLATQQSCPQNTLCVSPSLGSDTFGTVGGYPFATIGAALAAASSGQTVFLSSATYTETLTIPAGVTVAGVNSHTVIIRQVNPVADCDLVTMGTGTSLEEVTLQLTATSHVQLRAVVFPSGSSVSSKLFRVNIAVDNSAAGSAGESNVFGVHVLGLGWNGISNVDVHLSQVLIDVRSSGEGKKRGVMVDYTLGLLVIGVCRIIATNSSSSGGAGTYIGLETNTTGSFVQARYALFGGSSSDISQTAGVIGMASCLLQNTNAGGKSFTLSVAPPQFVWSAGGALVTGTSYYLPSGGGFQATEVYWPITRVQLVKSLTVHMGTGPSADNSCTWTIRRNSVDTALTVTATEGVTDVAINSVSVRLLSGDLLSLSVTCTGVLTFPTDSTIVADYF